MSPTVTITECLDLSSTKKIMSIIAKSFSLKGNNS